MTTEDRTKDLQAAPAFRLGALALAFALSAVTLAAAAPGGASLVAGRLLPGAGDPYATIAVRGATEVDILPGRIDVVGVRTHAEASDDASSRRG